MRHLLLAICAACVTGNAALPPDDTTPPFCDRSSFGLTQWDFANQLADAYCDFAPACVDQVVHGFCVDEQDCAAIICDRELADSCIASAWAGSIPAACWTLFQF
jgi:hypothetical protein